MSSQKVILSLKCIVISEYFAVCNYFHELSMLHIFLITVSNKYTALDTFHFLIFIY
jgi:hypothetical protein